MHGFLSHLTAALLALHTVLGCCWHHAHRCTRECTTAVRAESADSCHCEHAHGVGAASDSDGQGHHGRHDCLGSTCIFLSPTKTSPRELTLQPVASPVAWAPCEFTLLGEAVAVRSFFAPDALLPPLRLHLVDRVLLI